MSNRRGRGWIEMLISGIVYDKAVAPQLSDYMGQIFEQICTQFLLRENAKLSLPFVFGKIGRWWGNNPEMKRQEEIDILAVDDENAIFGECKWKNEPTGIGVLRKYKERYGLYEDFRNERLFFERWKIFFLFG